MKVQEMIAQPSNVSNVSGKEDKKVVDGKESTFQSRLRHVESKSFEERIHQLVYRITEQGQKLGQKIDVRELKIYKNLISEFLDEALGNSQKFSKQSLIDRRGRHKVYAVVKKINQQLHELTKDVLDVEKDHLRILQRLDDIRGLVLDLFM